MEASSLWLPARGSWEARRGHGLRCYNAVRMRIATGRVLKNGKVEVEGEPLEVGARVAIVVREEGWVLDAKGTQKLLRAIEQARRGEVFDAEEVHAQLPRRR
jgi:hypothetical protein